MMSGRFVSEWLEDKARGRMVREMDVVESEWPAHTATGVASGYCTPTDHSCSILLSVPSSRWFKPRMLWVDNENTAKNRIMLYVGGNGTSCSASIGGLWMDPVTTEFVAFDGITVGGDIWVSCLIPSCHVRITGILMDSGPEPA